METSSMTALISSFSRAYHNKNNTVKIFEDSVAEKLLSSDEYRMISMQMSQGIQYFNPEFKGNSDEALRWIVDNQLSPSPLGRQAYTEEILNKQIVDGATQYVILGAGFDTFAYRQSPLSHNIEIFEVDHPMTSAQKQERLSKNNIEIPNNIQYVMCDFSDKNWAYALITNPKYKQNQRTVFSLLGVTYYISEDQFINMLKAIKSIAASGSVLIFDYPDENMYTDKASTRVKKQVALAGGANEKMKASYSIEKLSKILLNNDYEVLEDLNSKKITDRFFSKYNESNPLHKMSEFETVRYCSCKII